MKVQLYSTAKGSVIWEKDGFVQLKDGVLSLEGVVAANAKRRAQIYLNENVNTNDKEAFMRELSSVFFVSFCRFGDIMDETPDTKKKVVKDEAEGISNSDDTEETE